MVLAELEARASKTAMKSVEEGASQPITFSFKNNDSEEVAAAVDLPEESFVHVLHFLDGHELVDASLVSKAWLCSTRLPTVWKDGVDMSRGMNKKELNMTGLLKLLRRPQFSELKAIALPNTKMKLGANGVKQLATALPHLETLDFGYYSGNTKAKDSHLLAAAELFPQLSGLRLDMWNATSYGIASVARAMGSRLVDLRIRAESITRGFLSQAAMDAIASSCPNLKYFGYKNSEFLYSPSLDGVRGDKVVALVKACPKLETLELRDVYVHVDKSHYLEIAEFVSERLDQYALRNLIVYGHGRISEKVTNPFKICELLSEFTFLNVVDKFCHPRLGTGVMFWDIKYGTDGIPKRTRNIMSL